MTTSQGEHINNMREGWATLSFWNDGNLWYRVRNLNSDKKVSLQLEAARGRSHSVTRLFAFHQGGAVICGCIFSCRHETLPPNLGFARDMKAVGIISFLAAMILGVAAAGNFMQDHARRERAIDSVVSTPPGNESGDVGEAEKYQDAEKYLKEEHNDEILGLIAIVLLIAALVMFWQAERGSRG